MKPRLCVLAAPPISEFDITDLSRIWGNEVEIVYSSIITKRTEQSIQPFLPDEGDKILMFVLEDGTHTRISVNKLVPYIEQRLEEIKTKVDIVFLACGGDFPQIDSPLLFVQPNIIIRNMVSGMLLPKMRIGVITPDEQQVSHVHNSWLRYLEQSKMPPDQLYVEWAPPSRGIDVIKNCARKLANKNVDLVVVECLGFTEEHRKIIAQEVKKPVILIRTVMANLIKELIG